MTHAKLGVIIGRFQPFHNGHAELIRAAIENTEKLIILVGSATEADNFNNPLSITTRMTTLREYVGITEDVGIIPIPDFPSNDEWVQEVISHINHVEEDPSEVILYVGEKDKEYYRSNMIYPLSVLEDSVEASATSIREELYTKGTIAKSKIPECSYRAVLKFQTSEDFPRLKAEHDLCIASKARATLAHPFNNPIEPVVHALVIHKGKILLVKRAGIRGHGQWAIPGGYLENTESTREGAIRELREETGLDLLNINAMEVAQAIEENMAGLSTRTLGINYAYIIRDTSYTPELTLDPDEVLDAAWFDFSKVVSGVVPLFYNHLTIVRRLAGVMAHNYSHLVVPETGELEEQEEQDDKIIH